MRLVRRARLPTILLLLAAIAIGCVHADTDADEEVPLTEREVAARDGAALEALTQLARHIVRLPFDEDSAAATRNTDESSAARAFAMVSHFRRTMEGVVDWAHPLARLPVVGWEARSFPNSLELMRTRPWFRESDHHVSDDEDDQGANGLPVLRHASLVHVLAGRGFAKALEEVLKLMTPETARAALKAECIIEATLNLNGVTPLHLLALYSPDTPRGNVRAAQLLLSHGANFSATASDTLNLTPIMLAGERGHLHLFSYFMKTQLPRLYLVDPATPVVRTTAEQAAHDEWLFHRGEILALHDRELLTGKSQHNETEWAEYVAWYDTHEPRTPDQLAVRAFEEQLLRTLTLAAMSAREEVVRMLLEGPSAGYHLRARLNERSHGGRGDCLLHGAVIHGHINIVTLLLAHGADASILSHDKRTPHQLAIQFKRLEVAGLLEQHLRTIKPPPKTRRPPGEETAAVAAAAAASTPTPTPTPTSKPAATPATPKKGPRVPPSSPRPSPTTRRSPPPPPQPKQPKSKSKSKPKGQKRRRKPRTPAHDEL